MHIISKQGSADNVLTYEHICDTAADMAAIERKYITLGSVCIVLQGESGAMEVYMADSDKEWHDVIVTGGGSGSGESAPAGLSLYICTSSEVANGKPDVEAPTEGVLYLVPSGNESGNLYDEYIYVNDAWELFGGASIDLTGYVTTQEMNSALAAKANSADIPAWAKAAQKPTYTAQEVGALPANTTIPTAVSDLTNDSGFVSPASQPAEDGTALVYVNGAWKAQKGYGYGDTTRSSLFSFAAADFTGDGRSGEYSTTIIFDDIMQDLTEEEAIQLTNSLRDIFLFRKEFEVKINDTVYNSIQDNFEYEINSENMNNIPMQNIYHYNSNGNCIFALELTESGIIFYIYDVEPTSSEIIAFSRNYTSISKDLLPDMPVKEGIAEYSAAEGQDTFALGIGSHAEGLQSQAIGENSHTEGQQTKAEGLSSHAEGYKTNSLGNNSHTEGYGFYSIITLSSTEEPLQYQYSEEETGISSNMLVEFDGRTAYITRTLADNIIEVSDSLGDLEDAPAKLYSGVAYGEQSHSEGEYTLAYGDSSHSEGLRTLAYGMYSHVEGDGSRALGTSSHAEGAGSTAEGEGSHAEGNSTATGNYSHSEGFSTVAIGSYQHVEGRNNYPDYSGDFLSIVGNGTSSSSSNAYALTWSGDGYYAGDVYTRSNNDSTSGYKLATEEYVTNAISASTQTVSGSTPTVTATANTTYVCGTVSTLSFTPAASGISDILFTSGSTATVLTVPNTVKFPEWFDPSNLSANTTYEISVMNGTYGAVMAWATT